MSEPREAIASALSSYLTEEQVQKLVDEILAINKRASAEFICKKCKQRQMAWTDIPDAKAVAGALADLLAQGFGRPSESSEKVDPIVFKRLTVLEELPDALRAQQEDRRGHAEERSEDGELRPEGDGPGASEADGNPNLQGVDTGD